MEHGKQWVKQSRVKNMQQHKCLGARIMQQPDTWGVEYAAAQQDVGAQEPKDVVEESRVHGYGRARKPQDMEGYSGRQMR